MSRETHRLTVDGQEILTADETSSRIIFNNLSGRNFTGEDLDNYIDWMDQQFNTKFRGRELDIEAITAPTPDRE